MMDKLNFPDYIFRFQKKEDKLFVFDIIRKKFVKLSPEEWVRQHIVHYLSNDLKYPLSLISVEQSLKIQDKLYRYDLVVFNRNHFPAIIIECKAPNVKLNESTLQQVSKYNINQKAGYVFISNGLTHLLYFIDFEKNEVKICSEFPDFSSL